MRRASLWLLVIGAFLVFLKGPGEIGLAQESSRPNVLLIISDDQAWTDYGFMGHPVIQTPHLDRLARESLVYTRGYVPDSLCRPSLATVITGLYPHQHGITRNDPKLPDPKVNPMAGRARPEFARFYETLMRRIETHPTLPRLLGKAGYVSLQTGKWWEGAYTRGGFTEGMTHGDPKRGGRHGDAGLAIGRQGLEPIFDFIRRAKEAGKPFFVWYAPMMPHAPHTPPEKYLQKYLRPELTPAQSRYYAMCEWFDQTCGDLITFLEKENLRKSTLIIYLADNGWIQDPNNPNRYAPRSKRSPYDGGIRTPIMLSWPGKITPLRDDENLASSIDIAPTVLTACGLPVPTNLPGINLMDRETVKQRRAIFGEVFEHDVADVDHPTKSLTFRWMIRENWKLIAPADPNGEPELYDVVADPFETRDLATTHPEVVKKLTEELDRWWSGKE